MKATHTEVPATKKSLKLSDFKAYTVFAIANTLKTGSHWGSWGALNQLLIKMATILYNAFSGFQ